MTPTATNEAKPEASEEEKFYKELDKKRSFNSCCTCQTLIIFFTVILILSSIGTYYLYYQITHGGVTFNPPITSTKSVDFSKQVSNIKTDAKGDFKLVLTSNDLTNLLNSGYSTQNILLKDINTSIGSSNIVIYGTLLKPISSKVTISAVPKVADGKILLDVNKLTAGNINFPEIMSSKISSNLSGFADQKMTQLYKNYIVENITLSHNQMTISGKVKK